MSSPTLALTYRPLLLMLMLLSGQFELSASSEQDTLIQATDCAADYETWTLKLPVWSRLFSNSSEIEICLKHLEYESMENIKFSLINGTKKVSVLQELKPTTCSRGTIAAGRSKTSSPELLLKLRCPSKWDAQVVELSLSGSGFVQEVIMRRNKIAKLVTGNCQLVQTIGRFQAENGSLISMLFALFESPQHGNMSLLLKTLQSKHVPIDFLIQRANGSRYMKSGNSELVWVDAAGLNEQLARALGLDSSAKPVEGHIQMKCGQSSECGCITIRKGTRILITPLVQEPKPPQEPMKTWKVICGIIAATLAAVLVLTAGKILSGMTQRRILIVSLERECDELCRQIRGLRLPCARLLLYMEHQQDTCRFYRTLQRDSLTAGRTFLLADVQTARQASRILQIWSMESARFSLLLLCQEEAVSEHLMVQLRQSLGPQVTLQGVLRWAIVTSAEDCASNLQQAADNLFAPMPLNVHDQALQ